MVQLRAASGCAQLEDTAEMRSQYCHVHEAAAPFIPFSRIRMTDILAAAVGTIATLNHSNQGDNKLHLVST